MYKTKLFQTTTLLAVLITGVAAQCKGPTPPTLTAGEVNSAKWTQQAKETYSDGTPRATWSATLEKKASDGKTWTVSMTSTAPSKVRGHPVTSAPSAEDTMSEWTQGGEVGADLPWYAWFSTGTQAPSGTLKGYVHIHLTTSQPK